MSGVGCKKSCNPAARKISTFITSRWNVRHVQALIDWVSLTVKSEDGWPEYRTPAKVSQALYDAGLANIIQYSPDEWKRLGGRSPYNVSWQKDGVAIFAGKPNTVLIELSGQGCMAVGSSNLKSILCGFAPRVTRIDLAADMECATSPWAFVDNADAKHIRARGYVTSDTGTTVYLGSRKSERYVRVYRYHPPHPRAAFLRCEMVFRGDYAKAVSKFVCENGLEAAMVAYGNVWGWRHPEWQPNSLESRPAAKPDMKRSGHNTVRWLILQAAPAFRKCVQEGLINDAQQFLSDHFMENKK